MSSNLESPLFYIGRALDPATGKPGTERVLYDPADLTTHGFVTGMTGSGKTGLCIGILEEAALKGIPSIIIDPKGDLTNLVMHFPNLAPADFEPWIDPEASRRLGKSVPEMAAETAQTWQKGLADAGMGQAELLALSEKVDYAIYTPGSTSGLPINILASFAAPGIPWEENKENLREKISSTVTALLGLVGMGDIDPIRSREHILLSNLVETAWSSGNSLDMNELIMQVQKPPFDRLGAFPMDSFFPEKDRFGLAILLNNFLASPSFQVWQEGTPLDAASLLFTPAGKPRHSIIYIAHLNDNERMFFVTLLFAAIETWMRGQRGTSGLRALVYFDEIMGYLPPTARPSSHTIMLRMLKQARAFGVGLLLATQNPVDLDYKALSNAGTWMIGRLQTEQDRERLLEGLLSADSSIDRNKVNELFSKLGKRIFLLHNVHDKTSPKLFGTRFALNYLAGPMTRTQIPELNALAGVDARSIKTAASAGGAVQSQGTQSYSFDATAPTVVQKSTTGTNGLSSTHPALPAGVVEYFIPNQLGIKEAMDASRLGAAGNPKAEGVVYRPALLAQAEVRYINRRYNLDFARQVTARIDEKPSGLIRWEDYQAEPVTSNSLHGQPLPQAKFAMVPGWLADARQVKSMEKDFLDWAYRNGTIKILANEALKVYAGPETSEAEFRRMCEDAVKTAMKAEQEKLEKTYKKKIADLEKKIERQAMDVEEMKGTLNSRRLEEAARGGEFVLSLLGGRKKSLSTSITKRRMTAKAKSDYEQEMKDLELMEKDLEAAEKELETAARDLEDAWMEKVADTSEISITPLQKDIYLDLFGVVWQPHYLVETARGTQEVAAFK